MLRYFWLTLAIVVFAMGAVFSGSGAFADDQMIEVEPDYICKCQFKKVPNVAGNYSGTIEDSNGTGTLMVTLTQHRAHIEGNWTSSYTNGPSDSGSVTGIVKQKAVKIQLLNSNPKCKLQGTVRIGSNSLEGALVASRKCTIDSASVSIDK
jgi:hypothetical protein